jgi:hypothetical protein
MRRCIQRHNIIGQLVADQFYDSGSDGGLTYICQKTCRDSLTKRRDAVKEACSDAQYYDEYEKTYWMPTYLNKFMIYALNMACLKRRYVNQCLRILRLSFANRKKYGVIL